MPAYYFDVAARDYTFADGAIELVIERVPCSASMEPSQSSELIFCASWIGCEGQSMLAMLANSVAVCKKQNEHGMKGESVSCP